MDDTVSADAATHVLGIDSGGSGVRVGVAPADIPGGSAAKPLTWSSATPAGVGDRGIDAAALLARVLPAARELLREAGARRLGAVCVGAAGMATLGDDLRARLPDALADAFGVRRLALAADAVTAYAGALGQRPGAVVAAGTGLIALGAVPEDRTARRGGTDGAYGTEGRGAGGGVAAGGGAGIGWAADRTADGLTADRTTGGRTTGDRTLDRLTGGRTTDRPTTDRPTTDRPTTDRPTTDRLPGGWRRADGWGHLLGDCGGGAWIGRAGLEAAMRAHDGRDGGSKPLLARLEAVFGPAAELPGKLYPRPDRPAVLASFAPEVGRCAAEDPVAEGILRDAARHIAEAAEAVCPCLESSVVALTGGLFRMGAPLLTPVREELAARLPGTRVTEAAGDPLDGALCVAAALATDELRLPRDPGLLTVV
ncbi:BadF/BadG/BcrA/BcrD ATPase family protein [Streptomyces hygroscopicus]|uniref:N-acetylglucosamine kinase n=1 Tax=Streptomyces hygroscopicus TaxID=1912 RepID=UPI00207BA1C8|nr:BadF/BadG/BcrA/BcrD ATPase family protein [Streptomyces hygroscopicus]